MWGSIWKKTKEGESDVIIFMSNDIKMEFLKKTKKVRLKKLKKKTHMTEEENGKWAGREMGLGGAVGGHEGWV